MRDFNDMTTDEQRNEILMSINNHLADISKFFEVCTAVFAKLSVEDMLTVKGSIVNFKNSEYYERFADIPDDGDIGCTKADGLSIKYQDTNQRFPLGDDESYTRTTPINEEFGDFLN